LLALVVFVGLTSVNWSPEEAGIQLSDPEAVKHHGTEMVAVTDRPMDGRRNVLWCATMQMAWDRAAGNFGRPLRVKPHCQLADSLNRQPFDRRWVDEASVFTASGQVNEGVLDKIDAGMRKKAARRSVLLDDMRKSLAPGDLVFFASLDKDLKFPTPYGKLGGWQVGDRKVSWFGFTPDAENTAPLHQQTRVHHYGARNDFMVELVSTEPGDQFLLAKLPVVPKSPEDVIGNVLKHLQKDAPQAGGADLLAVPNVSVRQITSFNELQGKTVAGANRFIREARQSIEFLMDEKGVKLHSEAEISFSCAAHPRIDPRLMILDPPFAIVMKRRNAPRPYFVAWMANADLLAK